MKFIFKNCKTHKIRNLLNNEQGATSILIIFMMLVLVTLATFSIATSNINIQFGKKTVSLNEIFYSLESDGEKYLKDVDYMLAIAQDKAYRYMDSRGYEKDSYDEVPANLQDSIFDTWNNSDDKNNLQENVFNKIYLYFANENIEKLSERYPDNDVLAFKEDNSFSEIETQINIVSSKDIDSSLEINLSIRPLEKHQESGFDRYVVEKWEQQRTGFEYDLEPELWDGTFE